jgi:hypothetical protein
VRPQLCEINHSSAIWLHSFVFLLVFSICRQGLSLLGEVDRATSVDNQRSRGAAIAGFRAELFGSRIELCRDSTKSRDIRTFRKIGIPSSHQPTPRGGRPSCSSSHPPLRQAVACGHAKAVGAMDARRIAISPPLLLV